MMKRQTVVGLLVMLVLPAVLIGLWFLRPGIDAASESATSLQITADCDSAQRACGARGEDLEIELRLGPPVRPMEAFEIQLQGTLAADAQVAVQFQMRGMDMGLNRYRLIVSADGVWHGRAILPACTAGRSDWLAQVEILQNGRRWRAEFPFAVLSR